MDSFFGMLAVLLFVSGLAVFAARPYINKNIFDKLSSNNKLNDLPLIQTVHLEQIKQRLIEEGILLKSNENTRQLLISTINFIGIETEIHFVESLPSTKYISLPLK